MVKNTQAGTPSANSDKIPMPRASAVVQHRTFDAGHPGIPRAGKNDDWESWKWDGRWWWGWRSKDGGWWSGEDWIKTEERTKTKSKEWSEELGIDSGEAKTEERTETKSEGWTEIKECTKSGGWEWGLGPEVPGVPGADRARKIQHLLRTCCLRAAVVLLHTIFAIHSYVWLFSSSAMTRRVNVNGPGGHLCTVHVHADAKGSELKTRINQEMPSIKVTEMRLFHREEEVEASSNLADFENLRLREEPLQFLLIRRNPEVARWLQYLQLQQDHGTPLLADAPDVVRIDKEAVLAAVTKSGWNLKFASKGLKADKDVVLTAVRHRGWTLAFAAPALKGDKEVVLAAVRTDGYALRWADPKFRADREVVLEAVQMAGAATGDGLEFASPALRADKEIVLASVRNSGLSLEWASQELQDDKEVVLIAVQENGRALESASPTLQADKEVVLAAVRMDGYALRWAPPELRTDRDVVLEARDTKRPRLVT